MPNLDAVVPRPFFIYIIESNRVQEVAQGFSEGKALQEVFRFVGIETRYHTCVAKNDFAIQVNRAFKYAQQINAFPVIHFAAHGNTNGIGLMNGELVTWQELGTMLRPLHRFSGSQYLLCFSACEGFHGALVTVSFPHSPSFGVVGPFKPVNWSDNVVGFAALYHLLKKGLSVQDAVKGMRAASGHDSYGFIGGEDVVQAVKEVTGMK